MERSFEAPLETMFASLFSMRSVPGAMTRTSRRTGGMLLTGCRFVSPVPRDAPAEDVAPFKGRFEEKNADEPLNATYAAMVSRLPAALSFDQTRADTVATAELSPAEKAATRDEHMRLAEGAVAPVSHAHSSPPRVRTTTATPHRHAFSISRSVTSADSLVVTRSGSSIQIENAPRSGSSPTPQLRDERSENSGASCFSM